MRGTWVVFLKKTLTISPQLFLLIGLLKTYKLLQARRSCSTSHGKPPLQVFLSETAAVLLVIIILKHFPAIAGSSTGSKQFSTILDLFARDIFMHIHMHLLLFTGRKK